MTRGRKALTWLFIIIAVIILALMVYYEGAAQELYSVKGHFLFGGEPAPVSFELGLCEVNPERTLCAYSVVPPGPRGTPDEDGRFEIHGVPPGDYGLIIQFSFFHQILPWWPDGSEEILFEVNDNVDLGNLFYDDWPCELFGCRTLHLPIIAKAPRKNISFRP